MKIKICSIYRNCSSKKTSKSLQKSILNVWRWRSPTYANGKIRNNPNSLKIQIFSIWNCSWKLCSKSLKNQFGIGERGNSVYGMRAPGYGGKGEDGKAKTQWWERGVRIFPLPFLTTAFWPSHPPLFPITWSPHAINRITSFSYWLIIEKAVKLAAAGKKNLRNPWNFKNKPLLSQYFAHLVAPSHVGF